VPKAIEFPNAAPQWVSSRDCVRFFALVDGQVLQCFVSVEALMDHFGIGGRDSDEAVRAFEMHRSTIQATAKRKIETVENMRGSEVLLRSDDFPRQATTVPSPRVKPLTTNISSAIRKDPALLSQIDQANSILNEEYVRPGMRITAEWDVLPTSGEPLVQLVLKDDETEASVNNLFTRDDLNDLRAGWFSFFQIWMNLTDARGSRLRQAFGSTVAVGE